MFRNWFHLPAVIVALAVSALTLHSCASDKPGRMIDSSNVLAPVSDKEKQLVASRQSEDAGAFKPQLVSLIGGRPGGEPQHFATPEKRPEPVMAAASQIRPPVLMDSGGPLGDFRAKLAALDARKRLRPVVVVHIGDSHVASDSFTRGVRSRLQARFGDAGRGQVIPASAFKYAAAQSVKLSSSGSWRSAMSLKTGDGVFGLSGVRVESASSSARMTLTADETFDWAEVTAATGPRQGSFEVTVDGKPAGRFSARSQEKGAKTFHIAAAGKTLGVSPVGDGEVGILHWASAREGAGVRYINFGQIGATVDVTKRWNDAAIANDLASIKPDLVVYGFGTNEGFNDNLNVKAYRDYVAGFLRTVHQQVPDADIMIVGASDGARRRGGQSCGNGWYVPPKLGQLRDAMRDLAGEIRAAYWDWSAEMGGRCGIDNWARSGLAAKDRVHLTSKGYDKSAEAFYAALVGPLDTNLVLANKR